MKHVCLTWAPYFLRVKEMECRCSVCLENVARISQDPDFLSCVITVDKPGFISTICKQNVSQRCDTIVANPGQKRLSAKVSGQNDVLVAIFDCHGMVHQHVCPLKSG